jgi:hypothetical protein
VALFSGVRPPLEDVGRRFGFAFLASISAIRFE